MLPVSDLKTYCKAEKALLAFPNHFGIVYKRAKFHEMLGLEKQEDEAIRRAISLYGASRRASGLKSKSALSAFLSGK